MLIKAPFRANKDLPGGTMRWFAIISSLIEALSCKKKKWQITGIYNCMKFSFRHINRIENHSKWDKELSNMSSIYTFMRDKVETTVGKFWLISCIDCKGSDAWTILCAVWCPKSTGKIIRKKQSEKRASLLGRMLIMYSRFHVQIDKEMCPC